MIRKEILLTLLCAFIANLSIACVSSATPGDVDGVNNVDLKDPVIALQLISGITPVSDVDIEADVNNDNRLGLAEAIAGLQQISDYFTSLNYNYNEDQSCVRVLSSEAVDNYETVQAQLATQVSAQNWMLFHNYFEFYVTHLLQDATEVDSIPSYAPRGEASKRIVDVSNGKVDYSEFTLKGDINNDSKVDFTDLDELKLALFSSSSAVKYDINADNTVDIRDAIFLLARIGVEISYFDFYTPDGDKISAIPTRDTAAQRIFDYAGSETSVMVVPKDINRASGFLSGLSDIDEVWYKKTGWVYQEDAVATETLIQNKAIKTANQSLRPQEASEVGKGAIIKSTLEKLIDFDAVTSNPHLVGWHLSVQYVNVGSFKALDTYGMDGSVSYIQPFEDRIRNPHFAKTTMMHDKRVVTNNAYVLHLGIESDPVMVRSERQPIKGSLIRGSEKVTIHQVIHAASISFHSNEEHVLSGALLGNTTEGSINVSRIGPYPSESDFGSVETQNGDFTFQNLPYGAYTLGFENSCGCSAPIDNLFIFKDEEQNLFEVGDIDNVTVGLTIVDQEGEPLPNTAVSIRSSDCISVESNSNGTTNSNGIVTFTDIPVGTYDVYVDSKMVSSITFCDNYTTTVVIGPTSHLWKFKVIFSNAEYGGGVITAKNIDIDFEAEPGLGGTAIYAIADSTCGGSLYGCGDFAIYNDQMIRPGTKWVSFSSLITIAPGIVGEMSSGEIDFGMNGLFCDGHIPAGFGPDSGLTTWTYSNRYSSWTLTLEPCSTEGCD